MFRINHRMQNVENTPIIKNVETVESPGSNSGYFELKNDNVQNIEFDPKTHSKKPRTFACKKRKFGQLKLQIKCP